MSNDEITYSVTAEWDPEAKVWVAISNDFPGLVSEAMSFQKLVEKLQNLIPELCELNQHLIKNSLGKNFNLRELSEISKRTSGFSVIFRIP